MILGEKDFRFTQKGSFVMRKWILPGLFALSFGILANSAFGGNVADCDILTDPDPENALYAPKLYGLCVAWHNANESAKPALAAKFQLRAGFDVPGSEPDADFTCPCFADVSKDYICSLGPRSAPQFPGTQGYLWVEWEYQSKTYGDTDESFLADPYPGFESCWHYIDGTIADKRVQINLSGESQELIDKCLEEAIDIAYMYEDGLCPDN